MRRQSYEKAALEPFRKAAARFNLTANSGQAKDNRITLEGNVYYQFGDLRVCRDDCNVIVEVESAGGVTNIAKYWYCLQNQLIDGPVFLIHLYRQTSPSDYYSHLALWRFLADKTSLSFPNSFQAWLYTYREDSIEADLVEPLRKFAELITNRSGIQ